MIRLRVKRGDSFSFVLRREHDGAPVDLTGAVIAASVRDPSAPDAGPSLAELDVTLLNQVTDTGKVRFSALKEVTAAWPLRDLVCDVQHTSADGSYRRSSEDIVIEVRKDRT